MRDWQAEFDRIRDLCIEYKDQLQKSKQREEKLRECVEFYADLYSWNREEVDDVDLERKGRYCYGGKRARQCLKELGE